MNLPRSFLRVMMISALSSVAGGAQTATFEGLASTTHVPLGYAGVNWTNWFALDPMAYYEGSPRAVILSECATSGTVCAWNGYGQAIISSPSPFNLFSGNFLAFHNPSLGGFDQPVPLTVTAYLGSTITGLFTTLLDPAASQNLAFNFMNVDRITFDANIPGSTQNLFLADDLQFGQVPEPASVALVATGILGIMAIRRRGTRSRSGR